MGESKSSTQNISCCSFLSEDFEKTFMWVVNEDSYQNIIHRQILLREHSVYINSTQDFFA